MKTTYLIIAVISISIIATANVLFASKPKVMTDIMLANIEALADSGETPDGRPLYELHCGSSFGTQCVPSSVTGPTCSYIRFCP